MELQAYGGGDKHPKALEVFSILQTKIMEDHALGREAIRKRIISWEFQVFARSEEQELSAHSPMSMCDHGKQGHDSDCEEYFLSPRGH